MENRADRFSNVTSIKVEFYDVDSFNVVWHGNYVKYFEIARCHFLEKIKYNYDDMYADGYSYPVIKMDIKYIAPCRFRDELEIKTILVDYKTILQLDYIIYNKTSNLLTTKASFSYACVDMKSGRTEYNINSKFKERIEAYLNIVNETGVE